MTLASPALHARDDGLSEYLPSVPVTLVQSALRIESMLTHGLRPKLVDHENDLVGGSLPCPEHGGNAVSGLRRTNTQVRVFDRDEAINFVADAFARAYPVGTAKQVANDIGTSHRTTQRWCQREVAPSLHEFLNACQTVPELKAAMCGLLGLPGSDPKLQRALADLVRAIKP